MTLRQAWVACILMALCLVWAAPAEAKRARHHVSRVTIGNVVGGGIDLPEEETAEEETPQEPAEAAVIWPDEAGLSALAPAAPKAKKNKEPIPAEEPAAPETEDAPPRATETSSQEAAAPSEASRKAEPAPVPEKTVSPALTPADAYRLGAGDKVRVTVYNEPDLSGEFEVDGSGRLALPLIGEVNANKKTLPEMEKLVEERFRDGYLVEPRVSMEVLNFRHFFIIGEVKNPGSYPYVNALTVLNAVALAGGYTYRAKEGGAIITRLSGEEGKSQEIKADPATKVLPGDTINIKERFF